MTTPRTQKHIDQIARNIESQQADLKRAQEQLVELQRLAAVEAERLATESRRSLRRDNFNALLATLEKAGHTCSMKNETRAVFSACIVTLEEQLSTRGNPTGTYVVTVAPRESAQRPTRYLGNVRGGFNTQKILDRIALLDERSETARAARVRAQTQTVAASELAASLRAELDVSDTVICGSYGYTEANGNWRTSCAAAGHVFFLRRMLCNPEQARIMANAYKAASAITK